MQIFLETGRLWLRQFTEADVDNLFDLDSDPEVMRFVNGGIPTRRDVIEDDILPSYLRYYERFTGYGFWAAIEKATEDFLGWFHLRPLEGAGPDEVELGYRLRKAAWGQSYATEASRALIHKGFTEFGVRRVVASTFADNLASRRVMEKAGMTLVRTYRSTPADNLAFYGITCPELFDGDDVEYALDKADWEQQEVANAQQADAEEGPVGGRSPEELLSEVASSYDLAQPSECVLIHSGLNDVYRINTHSEPVILKLYRAGWRTLSEVLYEVDVLLHLGRKRVPVCLPLARRDGSFTNTWPGPDGLRHAVLFTYVKGEAVGLAGVLTTWPCFERFWRTRDSSTPTTSRCGKRS